jgi:SAM-dependent methyltransferase
MIKPEGRSLLHITWLSALILFLEMLVVRWVGTEIRVFAYLQNGVLVAAFLGLGLGCRNARRPVRLLPGVLALLLVSLAVRDPFDWGLSEAITQGLAAFEDSVIWARRFVGAGGDEAARLLWSLFSVAATIVLLACVAAVFHPLGQVLGRWLDGHLRPIAAYSANILGSLLGIALFTAATLAELPPWTWLLASGLGLLALAPHAEEGPGRRRLASALALGPALLTFAPSSPSVWSPYQKLTLEPFYAVSPATGRRELCGQKIYVNNTGYQLAMDLDPARMSTRPDLYPPDGVRRSHFFLPYALIGTPGRVLAVGSGNGNDVAAALLAGARSVHAVEIDPVIVRWGRAHHPNRPYSSDRVTVTTDDARAFFRRTQDSFDVIWFGALDSHTNPSAYTNVRLDHFVYTRESFEDVKRLLSPRGVVVLCFDPQTVWIADRLVGLLTAAFGTRPLSLNFPSNSPCLGHDGLLLLAGAAEVLEEMRSRLPSDGEVRRAVIPSERWPLKARLTTDDWPYLYLRGPGLPRYHLLVAASCLVVGLALRRRLFRAGEPVSGTMLLLGAGFMLLEVSGVSRAALLYGTTWVVNAYVVAAVLGMILLANWVASLWSPAPEGLPSFGLVLSLVALGLVPTAWLAALPAAARVLLGGAFLALPVFFAGLIFVALWARSERKDLALGSNLLGSLLGGVASMLSMVTGFRALTFLTLAIYIGALLLIRKGSG